MIDGVQNALNSILGAFSVLNNASGAGRIFELYIMTGIALEMKNRGFEVWLQRSDGTRILPGDTNRAFIQRGGGPTGITPASAGPDNASVIGLQRPGGDPWELWNGIQFRGRSGADHEFDIALVPATVGATLRISGGTPFGRPRVAIECKDVGQAGSIDEMRTFVARLYDVTVLNATRSTFPIQHQQWVFTLERHQTIPFTTPASRIGMRTDTASMLLPGVQVSQAEPRR